MKIIYLVRHAKSYWGNQSLSDFDRPLNKRGKLDAPFMGKILNEKKIKPELMISSPAKRTKKTAIAIAEKISFPEKKILYIDELYEASANIILKLIKKIEDDYTSVMLFGHNPGLTLLNNQVSLTYIENIPTCGVVALEFNGEWSELEKDVCKQLFFEYPKLYKK
jgi:phosphohistidine phosphatase